MARRAEINGYNGATIKRIVYGLDDGGYGYCVIVTEGGSQITIKDVSQTGEIEIWADADRYRPKETDHD